MNSDVRFSRQRFQSIYAQRIKENYHERLKQNIIITKKERNLNENHEKTTTHTT